MAGHRSLVRPILVVPLSSDDAGQLTLSEWWSLCDRRRVLFEDPAHPLASRLKDAGVEVGDLHSEPNPADGDAAVVADPSSPVILALARSGAEVTSGASAAPDSLTAAHGATTLRAGAARLGELALIMARLRSEDGCPWDREQDHRSLIVHLLEETYEVIDAVEDGSAPDDLREELGDLLLQIFFHAQMADDAGRFDIADVAAGIVAKLVRRHPHVFAGTEVSGAAEVVANWEAIKADEKGRDEKSRFDDIPSALPALVAAHKTQKRAAGLGWSPDEHFGPRFDEVGEIDPDEADARIGDMLFRHVALARLLGVDPEGALRRATARFQKEFP